MHRFVAIFANHVIIQKLQVLISKFWIVDIVVYWNVLDLQGQEKSADWQEVHATVIQYTRQTGIFHCLPNRNILVTDIVWKKHLYREICNICKHSMYIRLGLLFVAGVCTIGNLECRLHAHSCIYSTAPYSGLLESQILISLSQIQVTGKIFAQLEKRVSTYVMLQMRRIGRWIHFCPFQLT